MFFTTKCLQRRHSLIIRLILTLRLCAVWNVDNSWGCETSFGLWTHQAEHQDEPKKPPACLRASACSLGFSNPATAAPRWLKAVKGNILLLFVFLSGSLSLSLNSAGFLLSNHAACPRRGWARTKTDAVTKTQRFPFVFNGTPCGASLFNINRKMTSLFIEVLYWIHPHLPAWLPDLITWAFGGKKISPLPYC